MRLVNSVRCLVVTIAVLLLPAVARAQSYTSPTFQNVTVKGNLNATGAVNAGTLSATGSVTAGGAISGASVSATGAISSNSMATTSMAVSSLTGVTSINGLPFPSQFQGNLANIAVLRANATIYPIVNVAGYFNNSDGGGGIFVYNPLSTAADNGGTVIVDAASHRWLRQYNAPASVRWFGATGSAVTATASGSGNTVSMSSLGDFAAGHGILIPQAGSTPSVGVPTGVTITSSQKASITGASISLINSVTTLTVPTNPTGNIVPSAVLSGSCVTAGTTISSLQLGAGGLAGKYTVSPTQTGGPCNMTTVPGSSQYCYRIAALTKGQGVGVASAEVCATDGAATLGLPFDTSHPTAGETPAWSAVTGADGYVIYGNLTGAETAIATVDATQLTFTDYGHVQLLPPWIPSTPLSTAQKERVVTTVASVNTVNNSLTVPASLGTFSNVTVTHDDTVALASAWATGFPLTVDPGDYNISTTLTASTNNQTIRGSNWQASVIHAYGCIDILTWSSRKSDASDLGLDANNDACGNGLNVLTGANNHFERLLFLNPYNSVALTAYNYAFLDGFLMQTDHRGQYVVHAVNTAANQVLLLHISHMQTANSWSAVGVHIDGNVASTTIDQETAIQSMPTELLIDNAIGSTNGSPSFMFVLDTAFNNCDDFCVKFAGGAQQLHMIRTYVQGRNGNQQPNIYTDVTTSDVIFTDMNNFGADRGGIELHSDENDLVALHVNGNSITAGAYPDILVTSDVVGATISGGSNFTPGSGTANASDQSFVYVQSGAKNVQIYPGSAGGRLGCGTINLTSPSNGVTIGGVSVGSPPDTIDTAPATEIYTAGGFPNLYSGTQELRAKLCRSGVSADTIDRLDSATNILALGLPNAVAGSSFSFLYSNGANFAMTMGDSTGVHFTGLTTAPASGGFGQITRVLFQCIVRALSPAAISCNGTAS